MYIFILKDKLYLKLIFNQYKLLIIIVVPLKYLFSAIWRFLNFYITKLSSEKTVSFDKFANWISPNCSREIHPNGFVNLFLSVTWDIL